MNALQQKTEELTTKRQAIAAMFEAAGEDLNFTAEQVDDLQQKNKEAEDLATEVKRLVDLRKIETKNATEMENATRVNRSVPFAAGTGDLPTHPETKSLGDLFIESKAYAEYSDGSHKGPIAEEPYEVKTVFTDATGFPPQAIRTGQVILSAQQQPKIVNIIPSVQTTQIAVVFMQETTYTNAAAETAEGALYPEAALAYTETNVPVRKIAVFVPVTDEALADVDGMRDRINNRLTLMMQQRLDSQIVAGNGTAPNLTGILNTSGIQTQAAASGEPGVDTLFKAITKLRSVGFVEPDGIIMHPNNWQTIRLLRSEDGIYLFGPPSQTGDQALWGMTVVQSTYMTANTAIVGDFGGYTELAYKAGLEFEVSNAHNDYFARGQLAVRAQLRVAFVVLRPSALCSVTGLT